MGARYVRAGPRRPARAGWEQRAGVVAAYREFRGHDDAHEPIGPAPQPGQVEAYAAYRHAWRVAGRPEIDQAEHEMSAGLHRMRIRGWEREKAWGPRYVGNELAGTRQAADQHRRTATLRAAEADAAADPDAQIRLRRPVKPRHLRGRSTPALKSWSSSTRPARSGSSTPRRPAPRPRSRSTFSPSATPMTPNPSRW